MTQLQRSIKTVLCFLLPALLSFSSINSSKIKESEAWFRYWIVLAFALLLELLLDHYLEGNYPKLQILVKVVFILCLLSPCDNNGSDLIHDKILLHITKIIQNFAGHCWSTLQSMFNLKTDNPGYTDTFSQVFMSLGSVLNLEVGNILLQTEMNYQDFSQTY